MLDILKIMKEKHYSTETGQFSDEFNRFYKSVGQAGCDHYDCNQVLLAMYEGWSPAEAAEEFNYQYHEDKEFIQDQEQLMEFDFSMND